MFTSTLLHVNSPPLLHIYLHSPPCSPHSPPCSPHSSMLAHVHLIPPCSPNSSMFTTPCSPHSPPCSHPLSPMLTLLFTMFTSTLPNFHPLSQCSPPLSPMLTLLSMFTSTPSPCSPLLYSMFTFLSSLFTVHVHLHSPPYSRPLSTLPTPLH